jgi:hypothetical protein
MTTFLHLSSFFLFRQRNQSLIQYVPLKITCEKELNTASFLLNHIAQHIVATPTNSKTSTGRSSEAIRTHGPLYSSSIRPSQQDSLLYTQFSRTHPSSISSSVHSIHCGTHLSLYLNISMCDLVLKDLLRRI